MLSYRDCTTLYLSPNGTGNGKYPDERFPGNGPIGDIEYALTLLDQMRGGGMLQPITLRFAPGVYALEKPLRIRPTMSNVTFLADGDVTFSGGRRITGFAPAEFQGVPCFAAQIPEVQSGKWIFSDLYVDGLRADLTRYPEEGYLHMQRTERDGDEPFLHSSCFFAAPEEAAALKKLYRVADAICSFNHYWIDEHSPLTAMDPDTGKLTLASESQMTIRPGQEYILENVAETFRKPNQWYLDRGTGTLYYIPRDASQTPENIVVYAPVATELIRMEGQPDNPVTGVRFTGIRFAYTRSDYASRYWVDGKETPPRASDGQAVCNMEGVVNVRYARNVVLSRCRLENLGHHAVFIGDGCRGIHLERCNFYDGAAGGVRICGGKWEDPEHTRTYGCTVSDCTIRHMGRKYMSACGILVMHAAECELIHNDISDLYYTGISCGWIWGYAKSVCRDNRIIGNHIWDLGKGELSDMGGVYLLGTQPGTVVSGNHIHHILRKDYGGWALYTDEGSTGILLENNLCYDTSSNCYHQHYGSSNVVRNNIFAYADEESVLRCSRPEGHLSILFEGNIVLSHKTAMMATPNAMYPGAHPLDEGAVVSRRNLFWRENGPVVYSEQENLPTLEAAQAAGMEEGSCIGDPGFADPHHGDFTLSPDSPALALGFVPFDWRSAGVRPEKR